MQGHSLGTYLSLKLVQYVTESSRVYKPLVLLFLKPLPTPNFLKSSPLSQTFNTSEFFKVSPPPKIIGDWIEVTSLTRLSRFRLKNTVTGSEGLLDPVTARQHWIRDPVKCSLGSKNVDLSDYLYRRRCL